MRSTNSARHFFFTINRLSQGLCLALLSQAAGYLCASVTHKCAFFVFVWFRNLLPFLFIFSHSMHDLTQGEKTQLAFGGSFELATTDHKASLLIKGFCAVPSEDYPAFLRVGLISHLFRKTFGRFTWPLQLLPFFLQLAVAMFVQVK